MRRRVRWRSLVAALSTAGLLLGASGQASADTVRPLSAFAVGHGYYSGTVGLTTLGDTTPYQLKDPSRDGQFVVDLNNTSSYGSGTPMTDVDDDWGTGLLSSRQSVAVDAQYAAGKAWDYFKNVHGRSGVAGDGIGLSLQTHYGTRANDAWFSGGCLCIVFGDGDGTRWGPPVSLDVVAREYTMAVVRASAGLAGTVEGLALAVATGDIFGTMTEFYANNPNDAPDYLIGERVGIGANAGVPVRRMDNPTLGCMPASMASVDRQTGAGVADHFFYLLAVGSGTSQWGTSPTCDGRQVSGIGNAKAEQIWYRALAVYMGQSTTHLDARVATLKAAADLYGAHGTEYNTVDSAWAAVSVIGPDPIPGGSAPRIANPGDQRSTTGQTVNLQITAADPGGLPLTYSASGLPPGLSIGSSTGLITGKPSANGDYKVTIAVKNSLQATTTTWFMWYVTSACPARNIMLNPGFEEGSVSWSDPYGVITNSSITSPARNGTWLAKLGTIEPGGVGINQEVTIPAACTSVTLSYDLKINSVEPEFTEYDKLSVFTDDTLIASYTESDRGGYVHHSFDASQFSGRAMKVSFSAIEDFAYVTDFLVDNVTMQVSGP
jgi:hypothetical protein